VNLLRHIQAVLWGFIGLGRREDMSELHSSGSPILLIATGVVIALVLVAVLIGLAVVAVRLAT
jgi:multisubunit Na+/H+ antiporter MnhC subunit